MLCHKMMRSGHNYMVGGKVSGLNFLKVSIKQDHNSMAFWFKSTTLDQSTSMKSIRLRNIFRSVVVGNVILCHEPVQCEMSSAAAVRHPQRTRCMPQRKSWMLIWEGVFPVSMNSISIKSNI